MDFDQVQREIFTLIWHVKLLVCRFRCVAADEPLQAVRSVGQSRFRHCSLTSACSCLRELLRLRLLRRPWMFLRKERHDRCKKQSNEYPDGKLCSHTIGWLKFLNSIKRLAIFRNQDAHPTRAGTK